MNRKKLIISMSLIAVFMVFDGFAIYTYGINSNWTILEAVIAGVLIAALLDIPPFFISSYGYAVLADRSADEHQKRTAKIISVIGTVYIFIIVSAILTMRIIQIRTSLADPEYDNLFMDTVFTVSPVLTTVFAICLALFTYEPNLIRLREAYDAAARVFDEVKERRDTLYNRLLADFNEMGAAVGIPNFFEAVRCGSEDMGHYINAVNKSAAPKITDRIRIHLKKLHNSLLEKVEEVKLYLDPYGPAPGILVSQPLSNEFINEAALLTEIDTDFKEMLNRQISDTLNKEFKDINLNEMRRNDNDE